MRYINIQLCSNVAILPEAVDCALTNGGDASCRGVRGSTSASSWQRGTTVEYQSERWRALQLLTYSTSRGRQIVEDYGCSNVCEPEVD